MPNWCENTLIVKGERTEIERFKNDGMNEGKWKISSYLPTPQELLDNEVGSDEKRTELRRKYGFDNWYDWRLANYGCKWDCEAESCSVNFLEDGSLSIWFDSPWSPPIEFLKIVQVRYPELDFKLLYMEGGCFFAGMAHTERDGMEGPSIVDYCAEPYYEDENGNIVDTDAKDFDFDEFEKEHTLIMRNRFED